PSRRARGPQSVTGPGARRRSAGRPAKRLASWPGQVRAYPRLPRTPGCGQPSSLPAMATQEAERTKGAVRSFWERTPCGSWDATAPEGPPEYFEQIERRRYELEPFIKDFARFHSTRDLDVLEIGVGLGTDHVQFARAGARLTGVDLTEKGIEMVRQ